MHIIGMVGPFGSGCTTVSGIIAEEKGYEIISLSDVLRDLFVQQFPGQQPDRSNLQGFGTKVRLEHGSDYLATIASSRIQHDRSYIIDSIRNPAEVLHFRKNFSNFFLFGVFADKDKRWPRVSKTYSNDPREFEIQDKIDGDECLPHGQRVTDTFRMSDIVL